MKEKDCNIHKKRIVTFIIVLSFIASVCTSAYGKTRYGHFYFEYYIEDGGIQICGYLGNEEEVTIPNFISGLPVYAIVEGAFADNETIRKLYIPDTIMTVEEGAISSSIVVEFQGNNYGNELESGQSSSSSNSTDVMQGGIESFVPTEGDGIEDPLKQKSGLPMDGAEETTDSLVGIYANTPVPEQSGSKTEGEEPSEGPLYGSVTAKREKDDSPADSISNLSFPLLSKVMVVTIAIVSICSIVGYVLYKRIRAR